MTNYNLWFADELDKRLAYVRDVQSFEYVKVVGGVGVGIFQFPKRRQLYDATKLDYKIQVYRQPTGGVSALDFTCFLREFNTETTQQGQTFLKQTGFDMNHLLTRRIVAYYTDSANTTFTNNIDNIMKDVFEDNFLDNADYSGTPSPSRSITTHGYSVQPDTSQGTSITKSFAWRNVLATLQDLQAIGKANGTEVFFGLAYQGDADYEFRTWTGQPGQDRTVTTGVNPIVFSLEHGNLRQPSLSYDYSDEATFAYATGKGQGAERIVNTANDRTTASRLNRIEVQAWSNSESSTVLGEEANNLIERKRPKLTVSGVLMDTPLTPYGGVKGWDLGHKVTLSYAGIQSDTIIRSVRVRVDADGREGIESRAEVS